MLLAINLALPLFLGNIAWQAHVGGLIAGILIAAVWDHMPLPGRTAVWRRVAVAVVVGGAALVVVLLVWAAEARRFSAACHRREQVPDSAGSPASPRSTGTPASRGPDADD